ncbi:MAG: pyridoxamine 5'-phosphate oxidase family protein [Candidatus Omnitrophota bacterium]
MFRDLNRLLKNREFISVATCDLEGRPNAVPKFLLKIEGKSIYLVDYTRGRTWDNLKINPRVSLSFMDTDSLMGYQVNGAAEVISAGALYNKIQREILNKQIDLSAKRVIEGVTREKRHQNFEVAITDKIVILKININEVVEIGPCGEIRREGVCAL